jgi:Mor family transcriptional regulator
MIVLRKAKRMKDVINDVFKKPALRFLRDVRDNYGTTSLYLPDGKNILA